MKKSIILNICYMIAMVLFFTPFLSIDDYVMSEYAYGIFSDTYDYCVRYENFIYGRIVTFFMRLVPVLPWYTILFYIWVFIALTLFTYMILKYFDSCFGMFLANVMLLFFSYEGYVTIQFSKVAGIVGAVGFFALILTKSSWKLRTCGGVLFFLSCLIRDGVSQMVVAAWIFAICIIVFGYIINHDIFKFSKKSIICIVIGILIYIIVPYLPQYSSQGEKDLWTQYWKFNTNRASIQDYGYAEYGANAEAYDEAGITENDLFIWYSWNADSDALTRNKGKVIDQLKKTKGNGSKYFNLNTIEKFFKEFPEAFLTIDVFFALLLIVLIVFLGFVIEKKTLGGALAVIVIDIMALNYYLFVNGRYLQHRVDISIVLVEVTIFMYVIIENNAALKKIDIRREILWGIAFIMFISSPYQYYDDDKINYNDNTVALNKIFYQEIEKDSTSCYYFGARRDGGSTAMRIFYTAFEVPEVGMSQNCFFSNTVYDKERMKLYGIDKIFEDITDSDYIYLVLDQEDGNQEEWEKYISKYSGRDVKLILAKQYCKKNIYYCVSKPLNKLVKSKYIKNNSKINKDIEVSISNENMLTVRGNAYLEGESGFLQNMYIQIKDSQTNKYDVYPVTQTCDISKEYGKEGYFSKINTTVQLPDFFDETDKISIIIEQDGEFYSTELGDFET